MVTLARDQIAHRGVVVLDQDPSIYSPVHTNNSESDALVSATSADYLCTPHNRVQPSQPQGFPDAQEISGQEHHATYRETAYCTSLVCPGEKTSLIAGGSGMPIWSILLLFIFSCFPCRFISAKLSPLDPSWYRCMQDHPQRDMCKAF